MNKVYKVIWSKVRNCYMVVSELAKRNGKCSSALNKKIIAAFLATGMVCGLQGNAEATGVVGVPIDGISPLYQTALGTRSVAVGDLSYANYNSVAVGYYAKARGEFSTAVGYSALANDKNAIAVGREASAADWDAIAVGRKASAADQDAIAVGREASAAAQDAVAVGRSASAAAQDAIAVGREAYATAQDAIAVGRSSKAIGQNAIAVGRAQALAQDAIAVGVSAVVRTKGSIAIGSEETGITRPGGSLNDKLIGTTGSNSIAIGTSARNYTYNAKMDEASYAHTNNSIAIGHYAHTHASNAFAIGFSTDATGERAFAIGTSDTSTTDRHSGARAAGQGSIAFGDQAETVTSAQKGIDDNRGRDVDANDAVAIGTRSWAASRNAIALGGGTSYTADGITFYSNEGAKVGEGSLSAIAIGGELSEKLGDQTIYARVTTAYAAEVGREAQGAIAIGAGSLVSGISASVNADQSIAIGMLNTVQADAVKTNQSIAIGVGNTVKDAPQSAAIGQSNEISGTEGYIYVVGGNNKISNPDKNATYVNVFGSSNIIQGKEASTDSSIIGKGNSVYTKLTNSLIAGNYNTGLYQVDKSQIIGNNNSIGANVSNLVVLGNNVTVAGGITSAVSIGTSAIVTATDGVALGSYSVASRAKNNGGAGAGYDVRTGTYYNGDDKTGSTWTSTLAAVSVGSDSSNAAIGQAAAETRQITGVAAGTADTDAVNVAQLKSARVEVKAGDNITVTTYVAPEGHLIYTISGMKGGAVDSDDRVVTLTPTTPDNKDEKSITSPYLHFNGLDKAATADYAQAKADDSIAMGRSATAGESARRGIAIGKNAAVHGEDTVALGPNAQASNRYAVALGADTKASIPTSVALGSQSVTTEKDTAGFYSGRVGYDVATDTTYRGADRYDSTWQSTDGSVSVGGGIDPYTGTPAITRRISNVAAGVYDTDVVNVAQLKRVTLYKTDYRSTAIGTDAEGNTEITSPYINVHGVKEAAEAKTLLNVYKTYESYETTLAKNIQTLTIEKKDLTRDVNTLASRISDVDAKMKALTDPNSEAYKTLADEKAYLVGEHTTLSSELKEITEELSETEARLNTAAEDYKKAQELVDSQARAEGKDSVAVGAKSVASGDQTIAMGTDNDISGNLSTAVGAGNTVTGEQSIAVGTGHEVHGNNSGVFGDPTIINADNSYSVGNNNTIGGQSKEEDVKLNNVFIIGNESSVDTSDTFVLGSNVTKTAENSVFLGNKAAYVEEGKTTAGMSDYSSETINGKTYHFAGGKPAGVVSVGNENETRRIQNVAAGKISADSTDAINGSQLYSAIENVNTNLGDQISNVDSRANKGIAGAAALAALHPLDFDPDDKLQFSAGMGHYRGKTAAAVGLFYRPDEKVMFNIGGTMGNGENLINAGITFSLDRTPRVTGSRTALTKEVVHLREHVARQDAQLALQDQQLAMQGAQIAQLTALVSQLTGKKVELPTIPQVKAPALFPDNLDNKWAYDKLEELEQQGYIRGYAGRTLSRDEFAAALDRALAGGATLEERLVKEFEPELSHVRVAHVEGKGNEEGEWYERPRTSYDKLEKHEIARKPFRVQKKEK